MYFLQQKNAALTVIFCRKTVEKNMEMWYNMMRLNVKDKDYKALNEALRSSAADITLDECCGQRFIAAGMSDKNITINGVPGNALGAYLNGATITVNANAQDAVGDTMNEGKIIIHGNIGDAAVMPCAAARFL